MVNQAVAINNDAVNNSQAQIAIVSYAHQSAHQQTSADKQNRTPTDLTGTSQYAHA
jgi:hypothetical protein